MEKYKPKLLEDWEKWDNSEEFRIIFREKLTKSEFIRIHNPKKPEHWDVWNEAASHYITHSEYLKLVLPTLFCEKYRPRGNQHQEERNASIFHQFLTWLFETDLDERRNRNYPNFSKSIGNPTLSTTHPLKLGDAETFNSWHTMPFFAKEVADDISFDNVVEKIKNNSNDEQKLFIHHLAEDELILPVQISNLIGMMNPRHILSLVVSRSKAPFEDKPVCVHSRYVHPHKRHKICF